MADLKSDAITSGHFATKVDDNPLWQYACQVYSQAGMEAALLNLQDAHGADINLILHALWLASEGIEWTSECIPADYEKWVAEQVIPIRTMRRRLKTDWVELRDVAYEGFRQQVKKLELKAEQYALAMLFISSAQFEVASRETIQDKNLQLYHSNFHHLAKHAGITADKFNCLLDLI